MKIKLIIYVITCILLLNACESNKDRFIGSWTIESIYEDNRDITFDFFSHGINLMNDNTCFLPVNNIDYCKTEWNNGKWSFLTINDKEYLKIESLNDVFNREFEITNIEIYVDTVSGGNIMRIQLISERYIIKCYRPLID